MATGHVRRRGERWYFVHWIDDPGTGRRRQKWQGGYATRKEAERALRESLSALDHGSWTEPTKLTYAAYVHDVWLPQMRDQVEGSTLESYERNMRVHVLPRIGAVRLQKLSAAHLNELYRTLQAEPVELPQNTNRRHHPDCYARIYVLRLGGCSYQRIADQVRDEFPTEQAITRHAVARIIARARHAQPPSESVLAARTVRYIHTIISRSLREAIRLGFLANNPAANASPPRNSKARPERVVWTADETRRFLSWAKQREHRLWPAWAFVATSGDRRGANLGVRWVDIDFDRATASLEWTVTAVRHQIVVKPYGKGGELHEIILDRGTINLLRWWRAQQAQERLACGHAHACRSPEPTCGGAGYHARDLVFCQPDGDYLHPERFSREFKRAQCQHNRAHPDQPLPVITLHALRHGWATLALEAGVPMKVVQDRLNHSSERITADIYTRVRAPLQSDAAERVSALILPFDPPPWPPAAAT
jgi:integrase